MKPVSELFVDLDGFSLEIKLEEPLPPGFQLRYALSGESALAVINAASPDFVEKFKEQIRVNDTRTEILVSSFSYLAPTEFITLVAIPERKGAISYYVFTFKHHGVQSMEEHMPIIQKAINSVLMHLNWTKADEDERRVMVENQAIKYLNPDELEKLADAEQTIGDTAHLREALIEEIRERIWEPEKSAEHLEELKGLIARTLPVPPEHLDEIARKLRTEDIEQIQRMYDNFTAAVATRREILSLGTTRDYEDHSS